MSASSLRIPVLTYHGQNVSGSNYAQNDHVALAQDLDTIADEGLRIVPLRTVAEWHRGFIDDEAVRGSVAISFDDGTDYDVSDLDFPPHGKQTALEKILRNHASERRVSVHATCFVIASPIARAEMDAKCLFGKKQISEDWWLAADERGVLAVESHGWDHNHPAVSEVVQRDQQRGNFTVIDTAQECDQHVLESSDYIASVTRRRPVLFAYPFGEASAYMRKNYLPKRQPQHGILAAFSTAGKAVTRRDDVWNLPRFVCGQHWREPDDLRRLVVG